MTTPKAGSAGEGGESWFWGLFSSTKKEEKTPEKKPTIPTMRQGHIPHIDPSLLVVGGPRHVNRNNNRNNDTEEEVFHTPDTIPPQSHTSFHPPDPIPEFKYKLLKHVELLPQQQSTHSYQMKEPQKYITSTLPCSQRSSIAPPPPALMERKSGRLMGEASTGRDLTSTQTPPAMPPTMNRHRSIATPPLASSWSSQPREPAKEASAIKKRPAIFGSHDHVETEASAIKKRPANFGSHDRVLSTPRSAVTNTHHVRKRQKVAFKSQLSPVAEGDSPSEKDDDPEVACAPIVETVVEGASPLAENDVPFHAPSIHSSLRSPFLSGPKVACAPIVETVVEGASPPEEKGKASMPRATATARATVANTKDPAFLSTTLNEIGARASSFPSVASVGGTVNATAQGQGFHFGGAAPAPDHDGNGNAALAVSAPTPSNATSKGHGGMIGGAVTNNSGISSHHSFGSVAPSAQSPIPFGGASVAAVEVPGQHSLHLLQLGVNAITSSNASNHSVVEALSVSNASLHMKVEALHSIIEALSGSNALLYMKVEALHSVIEALSGSNALLYSNIQAVLASNASLHMGVEALSTSVSSHRLDAAAISDSIASLQFGVEAISASNALHHSRIEAMPTFMASLLLRMDALQEAQGLAVEGPVPEGPVPRTTTESWSDNPAPEDPAQVEHCPAVTLITAMGSPADFSAPEDAVPEEPHPIGTTKTSTELTPERLVPQGPMFHAAVTTNTDSAVCSDEERIIDDLACLNIRLAPTLLDCEDPVPEGQLPDDPVLEGQSHQRSIRSRTLPSRYSPQGKVLSRATRKLPRK